MWIDAQGLPRASDVARLAAQAFKRGEGVSPERAEPAYLRDNVALTDPPSKKDGRADAALERLGLQEFAQRRPPEVGPGIRKRAAIARALILGPEVLLLDEPTTGLDREAAGQVNEALELVRGQGVAVALVSHDYPALKRLADHVVEVKNGVIGYEGDAAGFLAQH
jgi:phospholipid/cholesterol/gamma-HCH transport system ATP-binding protein